jgi:hypothetical protein
MKKLSILIPCIPSRLDKFNKLYSKLEKQIQTNDVEVLSIMDNKSMSVGRKRQALFQLAQGKYVCQIDDDDDVCDNFITKILFTINNLKTEPEVITYNQECDLDGKYLLVVSGIEYPTNDSIQKIDPITNKNIMYRFPWHWCCWRNDIAKKGKFFDCNGVEDSVFPIQMQELINSEYHIDEILVKYIFRTTNTASPAYKMDWNNPPKICNLQVSE